jgi:hypothetical protein
MARAAAVERLLQEIGQHVFFDDDSLRPKVGQMRQAADDLPALPPTRQREPVASAAGFFFSG